MNILTIFSPTLTVGVTGSFPIVAQPGANLIVINESPANIIMTLPSGDTFYSPAYDKRRLQFVGHMAQQNGQVNWVVQSIPLPLTLTANQIVIEEFLPGECIPEVYPSPLIRQLRAFS